LNPPRAEEPMVEKFGWLFRVRDKVIQTENNYNKDVFNGDIGQIAKIDPVEKEVVIRFDQRDVVYDYGELDEISLAYAITIHKSQGSEFLAVVDPVVSENSQHRKTAVKIAAFCGNTGEVAGKQKLLCGPHV
jgi:exodeoxyribonuclease V alpha subunit